MGLSPSQINLLAVTGTKALKTSRRDFPLVLSDKTKIGATTVSGTMIAAHLARIPLFVTGGGYCYY